MTDEPQEREPKLVTVEEVSYDEIMLRYGSFEKARKDGWLHWPDRAGMWREVKT